MKDDKPRDLQRRWTKELTGIAMTALTKMPPDLDALKSIFGEISIEGQSYIDCRGFTPASAVSNVRLDRVDFSHGQLGSPPIPRGRFQDCRLVGVKFFEAVLAGEYVRCDFTGANFRKATSSTPLRLEGCKFTRADFSACEIDLAQFHECLFAETVFKRSYLTLCKFSKCTFVNPVLTECSIVGCTFIEPMQNMKWYDIKAKAAMTSVVREDAPWFDLTGATTSDVRIK